MNQAQLESVQISTQNPLYTIYDTDSLFVYIDTFIEPIRETILGIKTKIEDLLADGLFFEELNNEKVETRIKIINSIFCITGQGKLLVDNAIDLKNEEALFINPFLIVENKILENITKYKKNTKLQITPIIKRKREPVTTPNRETEKEKLMEKLVGKHLEPYLTFLSKKIELSELQQKLLNKVLTDKVCSLKKPNVRPWLARTFLSLMNSYLDKPLLDEKQEDVWLWFTAIEIAAEYIGNNIFDQKDEFVDTPENRKAARELAAMMHNSFYDYAESLDVDFFAIVSKESHINKELELRFGWAIDLIFNQIKNRKILEEIYELKRNYEFRISNEKQGKDISKFKLFKELMTDVQALEAVGTPNAENIDNYEKLLSSLKNKLKDYTIRASEIGINDKGLFKKFYKILDNDYLSVELTEWERKSVNLGYKSLKKRIDLQNKIQALESQLMTILKEELPTFFGDIYDFKWELGVLGRLSEHIDSDIGLDYNRINSMSGSTYSFYLRNFQEKFLENVDNTKAEKLFKWFFGLTQNAHKATQIVNDLSDFIETVGKEKDKNKKFLADWEDGTVNFVTAMARDLIIGFSEEWDPKIGTKLSPEDIKKLCFIIFQKKIDGDGGGFSIAELSLKKVNEYYQSIKNSLELLSADSSAAGEKAIAELLDFYNRKLTHNKFTISAKELIKS